MTAETGTLPPSAQADHRSESAPHLGWLDGLKGIAILWIVLNHVTEQIFGSPTFENPNAKWPSAGDQLHQLAPSGAFATDVVRWLGWSGDQGVNVFLLCTGLVLAYSLTHPSGELKTIRTGRWLKRRYLRVFPIFWVLQISYGAYTYVSDGGMSPFSWRFWASMAGIRVTPSMLYYGVSAWWYVGLLTQLYLVFPALWWFLRRIGPWRGLAITCTAAIAARLAGLLLFHSYLDAWARGAVVVTRLPEVIVGIAAGIALRTHGQRVARLAGTPAWTGVALLTLVLGECAGFTLWGMAVNPLLTAAGASALAFALLTRSPGSVLVTPRWNPLLWVGRHSLGLFLVNQIVIDKFVHHAPHPGAGTAARVIAAVAATIILTVALERLTIWVQALLSRWRAHGRAKLVLRVALVACAVIAVALSGEAVTRTVAPQEIDGWGERPSLQPSAEFGWTLRPSTTTEVRWDTYDDVVQANSLGFPGPLYPKEKPAGTYRVLVTGDAFSGADGVPTDKAWPRLLEQDLTKQLGRPVQVLNFSVTGYGPSQELRVLQKFVPMYHPDLVITEWFTNDFGDVLTSDSTFQKQIGFGKPGPNSLSSFLQLKNLRQWLKLDVKEPLQNTLTGTPLPATASFARLNDFKLTGPALKPDAESAMEADYAGMAKVSKASNASFAVMMVPASIQVCSKSDLGYSFKGTNVADSSIYDLSAPQANAMNALRAAGVTNIVDLTAALHAAPACPYQSHNMHWTVEGHTIAASTMAQNVVAQVGQH